MMNEKIKQMIDERGMFHQEELYEIAEAVVRECIDVIDATHGSKKLLRPDPYQEIVSNIQEHFGVE